VVVRSYTSAYSQYCKHASYWVGQASLTPVGLKALKVRKGASEYIAVYSA
jgi:hypothetical protein